MIVLAEILFWVASAWILYVFIGYPLLMAILARVRARPLRFSDDYLPTVSFVMAAFNEEKVIDDRLQNYLDIDYPRDLMTFEIGSDGSTDRTDEIITRFAGKDPSIHLTRYNRSGKTKIVYELAEQVTSDIIVFTDADVLLHPQSVRRFVRCFADPDVGGVVVRIDMRDPEANAGNRGERRYLSMEEWLKRNEAIVCTTVGPTGQCFAVRRGAYSPLVDYRLSDDVHLVISIALNGKRVWFAEDISIEETNKRTLWSEVRRRLRMGQQAGATFWAYDGTRFPWRSWVGFELWSHKILRHLSTIPALIFFVTSIVLGIATGSVGYVVAGGFSVLWALAVLVGLAFDVARLQVRLVQYPLYFTMMLASLTIGTVRSLFAGGLAMWTSPRLE